MKKLLGRTLTAVFSALLTLLGFVGCHVPHPCEYGAPAPEDRWMYDIDTPDNGDSTATADADSLR